MIESVEDQARTLAYIAEAQATAGDIKKALATITLALNYAKKIEDVDDRSDIDYLAEDNNVSGPLECSDDDGIDGLDATDDIAKMMEADGEPNMHYMPDASGDSDANSAFRLAKEINLEGSALLHRTF